MLTNNRIQKFYLDQEETSDIDTRIIAEMINKYHQQITKKSFNDTKLANARHRLDLSIKNFKDAFDSMQITEIKLLNIITTANLIENRNRRLFKIYLKTLSNLAK